MKAFCKQLWWVIGMDVLRLRWFWLLWLGLAGLHLWLFVRGDFGGSADYAELLLVPAFLAAAPMIVFGHRAMGTSEWWRTRPLDRRSVAIGKVVQVLSLVLLLALVEGTFLALSGFRMFGSGVLQVEIVRWGMWVPLTALFLAWLAAMTGTWRGYLSVCLLLMAVTVFSVAGLVPGFLEFTGPKAGEVLEAWTGLPRLLSLALSACVLLVVLVVVYHRAERWVALGGAVAGYLVLSLLFWPVSVPSTSLEDGDEWGDYRIGTLRPVYREQVHTGHERVRFESVIWGYSWDPSAFTVWTRFDVCGGHSDGLKLVVVDAEDPGEILGTIGRHTGQKLEADTGWHFFCRPLSFRAAPGVTAERVERMRREKSLVIDVYVQRRLGGVRVLKPGEPAMMLSGSSGRLPGKGVER